MPALLSSEHLIIFSMSPHYLVRQDSDITPFQERGTGGMSLHSQLHHLAKSLDKNFKAYEFQVNFRKTFQSLYSMTCETLRVISEGCRWGGLIELSHPRQHRRAAFSLVVFCTAAHGLFQVRQNFL